MQISLLEGGSVPNPHSVILDSPSLHRDEIAGSHGQEVGQKSSAAALRFMRPPLRAANMELLEPRRLLSVSYDSAGWTTVTPAAGSRVVYVSSSSGNDASSGAAIASPVRS